jgi:hypothetical protein
MLEERRNIYIYDTCPERNYNDEILIIIIIMMHKITEGV